MNQYQTALTFNQALLIVLYQKRQLSRNQLRDLWPQVFGEEYSDYRLVNAIGQHEARQKWKALREFARITGDYFTYPTAGRGATDRAALLQGKVGMTIEGIGYRKLSRDDIAQIIRDCEWLKRNPVKVDYDWVGNAYKRCSACNKMLPATQAYYHLDGNGLFKLKSQCKDCRNETERHRYYRRRRSR